MKSRFSAIVAAAAALAIALMMGGCKAAGSEAKDAQKQAAPIAEHDPLEVKVAPEFRAQFRVGEPLWEEVRVNFDVPGRVEVDETRLARAGSPVAGRIAELNAVEGQTVHRGQVLATLHSTELSEGQFGFLRAQSQQQLARRAAARAQQLLD